MSRKYYRTRIRLKLKDEEQIHHLYMYNGNLDKLCDVTDFNRVSINRHEYQWIKYYETVVIYANRRDLDVHL